MTDPTINDADTKKPDQEPEEEKLPLRETLRLLTKASRGYWAVNLVNFGDGIAYFGLLNLLVLYLQVDVGFSTNLSHVAVSSFSGIVTVGMFLGGGFVADWLGVRRALTLSLVLVLIGRLGLVLIPGPIWPLVAPWFSSVDVAGAAFGSGAFLALVIIALGEAVIQPALYSGVKEYSDKRTATMGYAIIYAMMNLGIVVESAISPPIRALSREIQGVSSDQGAGGIVGVFWFLIGVVVLLLIAHLLLFTKKVEQTQRVYRPDEKAKDMRSLKERILDIPILNPRFLFFIFILLPVRTLFAHQWLTIPDYIIRCFPASVGARFEWITGMNPLIIVIFVPLIAAWTRHVSVITMMIIGTTISAAATALLIPEPNVTLLLAYVAVFSLGEAVWSSRFLEYVADLAPAGKVGSYMGIATVPWFLAKATTGWYSGRMLDAFVPANGPQDTTTLWMIYGAIAMLSPIGLVLGRRWVEKGVRST
jgi:dipeptide/tripeptide permease